MHHDVELVEEHPFLGDAAVLDAMLGDAADPRLASGRRTEHAVAAVRAVGVPAGRDQIALFGIAHPVDLVHVQRQVRELREQRQHESLVRAEAAEGAIGGAVEYQVVGVAALQRAEHPAVPDALVEAADVVFHVQLSRGFGNHGIGRLGLAALAGRLAGGVVVGQRGASRLGHLPRHVGEVEAHLAQHRRGVVEHVLEEDLVLARHAVGDAPERYPLSGRWAIAAVAGVVALNDRAMRGVETDVLVAGPDDLVGHQADVREGVDGVGGVGHDLVAPVLQPVVVVHPAVVRIRVVDVADVLLFPDPVRDADDVVDDVAVLVLETAHGLGRHVVAAFGEKPVGAAARVLRQRNGIVGRHMRPGKLRQAAFHVLRHAGPLSWKRLSRIQAVILLYASGWV